MKIQKRLRCAARATGNDLVLSWQHAYPQSAEIEAKNTIAIMADDILLIDGLKPTEEIEMIMKGLSRIQ